MDTQDTRGTGTVQLPTNVKPTHYDLTLTPNLLGSTFKGQALVSLDINRPTTAITLHSRHLEIQSAKLTNLALKTESSQDATDITIDQTNETATFTFVEELQPGSTAVLHLAFKGALTGDNVGFYRTSFKGQDGRSRLVATTQLDPTNARQVFPCWDEPAIKTTFDIALRIPSELVALSNMKVISEKAIRQSEVAKGDDTTSKGPSATQKGDIPSTQKGDVHSTQKGDVPSTQKGDAPSVQKGDAPSVQKGDVSTQKGDVPSAQRGDVPSTQKGDVPSTQKGNVPSAQKGDVPSTQKGDVPSTQKGDVPSTQKGDVPSTQKGDVPSAQKGDVPSAQKGDVPSAQKGDVPSAQEGDAVSAQKGDVPSTQKGDNAYGYSGSWKEVKFAATPAMSSNLVTLIVGKAEDVENFKCQPTLA